MKYKVQIARRTFVKISLSSFGAMSIPKLALTESPAYSDFDCSTTIPFAGNILSTESANENTPFEDPSGQLSVEGTIRRALRWQKRDSLIINSSRIVLGVGFLDNPRESWKNAVIQGARTWTTAGNGQLGEKIFFDFSQPIEKCVIRIRRTGPGTPFPARNSSRLGRAALDVTNPDGETMNIYNLDAVPHEFGHVLGLAHEHTNPGVPITLKRQATIDYYYNKFGWSEKVVEDNLFVTGERCLRDPTFNMSSVMGYKIPPEITREGIGLFPSKTLTSRDLTCALSLYS